MKATDKQVDGRHYIGMAIHYLEMLMEQEYPVVDKNKTSIDHRAWVPPAPVRFTDYEHYMLQEAGEDPTQWTLWRPDTKAPFEFGKGQAPVCFGDFVRILCKDGRFRTGCIHPAGATEDAWSWRHKDADAHVIAYRITRRVGTHSESVPFEQWMHDTLTAEGEDPALWTRWIPTADETGTLPSQFRNLDVVRVLYRDGVLLDRVIRDASATKKAWAWAEETPGDEIVAYRVKRMAPRA